MAHLSKTGVNWVKQQKEYQKLQNEESMEALNNHSLFEVFMDESQMELSIEYLEDDVSEGVEQLSSHP